MLCDKCNQREARVYYTEIINGQKKEQHLCEECATEFTRFNSAITNSDFLSGILSSLFGGYYLQDDDEQVGNEKIDTIQRNINIAKCSNCGTTYEEVVKNGKLGCYKCYKEFGISLSSTIKKIQGTNQHTGKIPKGYVSKTDKIISDLSQVQKLSLKLQEAIEKEEFEEAAKLRDLIRELKTKEEVKDA